ncbi:hypothetical protein BOX15_Mlig006632g1 [Macrostomum lignano]|uniref:Mitogen-activated protein kinase kinase kinase kinase n=1 Tax=Macrostomum lignano TaxID=282301 RepID=A0A267ERT4_9PLAT|nr:hypothetical protein BOX15_Mlig006632g1 [Macrostomum lignano]
MQPSGPAVRQNNLSRSSIFRAHPELLSVIKGYDPWEFYRNIKEVGSGTYGHVYKVQNLSTDGIAALKCVKIEPKDDLKNILAELYALKDCQHANIVQFYGAFLTEIRAPRQLCLWMAMEYCGGKSLQDIYNVTQTALKESVIAFVCRESLRALAHMHSLHRLHRDIKGANILLTMEGAVKLADFGIAAQITATLGKRMSFIGTPYWMAPEVADVRRTGGYNELCDVWSVGITAIELAELEPPLFSLPPMKALQAIASRGYRQPTLRRRAAWTESFHSFLCAALRLNPRHRSSAAQQLQHQFIAAPGLGEHLTVALLREFQDVCSQRRANVQHLLQMPARQSPRQPHPQPPPLRTPPPQQQQQLPSNQATSSITDNSPAQAPKSQEKPNFSPSVHQPLRRKPVAPPSRPPPPRTSPAAPPASPHSSVPWMGAGLVQLFDTCPLKINCCARWNGSGGAGQDDDSLLLLGANEGLYCMSLSQLHESVMVQLLPMRCIWLDVYRDVVTAACGRHPRLYRLDLPALISQQQSKQPRLLLGRARSAAVAKVPSTKGCIRAAARCHLATGQRWLVCALPDSVVLLRWDPGKRRFNPCRLVRPAEMPQPLLTLELLTRPDKELPFACLGAMGSNSLLATDSSSSSSIVRFHLLEFERADCDIQLLPVPDLGYRRIHPGYGHLNLEELGLVHLEQLGSRSVLLCHGRLAILHRLDTGRACSFGDSSEAADGRIEFPFVVEAAQPLADSLLAFHCHGFQARAWQTGEVVQDVTDQSHVYRFLGFAGHSAVLERRPVSDPMASCDIVMVIGHIADGSERL